MIAPERTDLALDELTFANRFARLGESFFERRNPTPLPAPRLVAFNPDAAALIDLRPGEETRDRFVALAAGNAIVRGMEPLAAVYAGHQFGGFSAQLGDGRAILLGDVLNTRGEHWELQLKGGGLTAFSRFGDGRAVLRSTIREYLASEAMFALGIPTTRALSITGSDEPVLRERPETAAVLIRVAPTFVRFGSFEFFHYQRRPEMLKGLADYAIATSFPHLVASGDRYAQLFAQVVRETAALMAAWQSVGFTHGVMNTDNFSIAGLTLDYGPFGFMETYEPGFICNHSDDGGRYAFDQQPGIGRWNCFALGNALTTLVDKDELATILGFYEDAYRAAYLERARAKLGLATIDDGAAKLVVDLLDLMAAARADFTRTFRSLGPIDATPAVADDAFVTPFNDRDAIYAWLNRYRERLAHETTTPAERTAQKNAANPKYVLRNYLAQNAIERAENGNYSEIAKLHDILRRPFDEQPEHESYAALPPDWAATLSVSCSS